MQVTADDRNAVHELHISLKLTTPLVNGQQGFVGAFQSKRRSFCAWKQCLHHSVICYHSNK